MHFDNPEDLLNTIAPYYRHYVRYLWREFEFGLYKTKIDVEPLRPVHNEQNHQFSILLPYCGKFLKWEVIFEPASPWLAPDFRFDDDNFLMGVDPDFLESEVPSWANWDPEDPRALSKVITELMVLYRQHQIKLLNEDETSRAYFEYTALLGDSVTSESDIEVYVGPGRSVQFLIKLNVDTSQLPQIFNAKPEHNPGGDCALLLVRYPNPSVTELIMSPLVTRAAGNISLPLMRQSGVLMDYVPMVRSFINKRIQNVLANERMKQELLSQLIVKYEGAVLEHSHKGASFLFEINNFYWILSIDIDANFPEKPPQLTLRSVYHTCKGRPRTKILSACPYSSFEDYIAQQVEIFKNECKGNTTIHNINAES